MKFYKVKFFDKRDQNHHEHYVYTADIYKARAKIEFEEPYVRMVSWKAVEESELPDLVVVIQK